MYFSLFPFMLAWVYEKRDYDVKWQAYAKQSVAEFPK
jgi:hypothetical protein